MSNVRPTSLLRIFKMTSVYLRLKARVDFSPLAAQEESRRSILLPSLKAFWGG